MPAARFKSAVHFQRFLVLAAGVVLAVVLDRAWSWETRWFVVTVAGLAMVSVSLMFIRRFGDFLMLAFLFLLPLAGLHKWLFLDRFTEEVRNVASYSGAANVGLMSFLLIGFYIHWFVEIVVSRTKPLPRLESMDWIIVIYCVAHLMSIPGSPVTVLGVHALFHLVFHALIYFYLSRHIQREHLRWIIAAMILAVITEAALGIFQSQTGMLKGLILDKGAGGARLDYQYEVPGIRGISRATGTSYDSHSFGLFLSMLLPYALVYMMAARNAHLVVRLVCGGVIAAGAAAVFLSYSRSAWLTCVVSLAFAWCAFYLWRERHMLIKTIGIALIGSLFIPKVAEFVVLRFDEEGHKNLTARFDQYSAAWGMWQEGLLFGHGAGNYMVGLEQYYEPGTLELPVHNVFLWLGADVGLVGAVAFFVLLFVAMHRLGKLVIANREPTRLVALAGLTGLVAYVLDGLTNPLFRESLVYMMLWLTLSLAVALPRIDRQVPGQPRDGEGSPS